jgi:DUF1980 C-terminal domain
MLPIALYFLNLPNSTFSAATYAGILSDAQLDVGTSTVASKEGLVLGFKELANAVYDEGTMKAMEGKTGRLKGMYSPLGSDRQFTLFRVRMTCCAADAMPVGVVIVSDENITRIQPKQWVEVEGQIRFLKPPGKKNFVPVLHVASASQVKPTAAMSDFSFD